MLSARFIVILRHNTTLRGDADLALREWSSILGPQSQLLDREALRALLCPMSESSMPRVTNSLPWVAAAWSEVSIQSAAQLIRRSAFAQEVFVASCPESTIEEELGPQVGSVVDRALTFSRPYVVALAHSYIIESEGVLDPAISANRISIVVRALLEPFIAARVTPVSSKLRAAKKTTLSLSHDLHIYKAKFFPRMVRALINIYGRDAVVFDPYCGSGTALLEAALLGQDSIGSDIDPICEMISRSKVLPFVCCADHLKQHLLEFAHLLCSPADTTDFVFPDDLRKKIARRDRLDNTRELPQILGESAKVAAAIRDTKATGPALDLIRTLASDSVTKKIRYRFIGVGNGKYTIEIVKQSILDRLHSKLERAIQLIDVFSDLRSRLNITIGGISVFQADAETLEVVS